MSDHPLSIELLVKEAQALRAAGTPRLEVSLHVCRRLFNDMGEVPTIQGVRRITHYGSPKDVTKDLNVFWETLRSKPDGHGALSEVSLPPLLTTKFADALKDLMAFSRELAQGELAQREAELEREAESARGVAVQQVKDALAEKERAEEFASDAKKALTQAQHDRENALLALAEARTENDALLRRTEELQQSLSNLEKQRTADKESWLAESARMQREFARQLTETQAAHQAQVQAQLEAQTRLQEQLEGDIKFAKQQIDEARADGRLARDDNLRLKNEIQAIEDRTRAIVLKAREQEELARNSLGDVQGELKAVQATLTSVTAERDNLKQLLDRLSQQPMLKPRQAGPSPRASENRGDAKPGSQRGEKGFSVVTPPPRIPPHEINKIVAEAMNGQYIYEVCEIWESRVFVLPDQKIQLNTKDKSRRPITPAFESPGELEEFLADNIGRYRDMDELPQQFFWQSSGV